MNKNNAYFDSAYGKFSQLPKTDSPEIAFIGRSNVGKSTLINKFFNRKNLARTSSMPGKTITINFYKCDGLTFADLPGYGYAKASKSEQSRIYSLINDYLGSDRNIKFVFVLLDMRRIPSPVDLEIVDYLNKRGLDYAVYITKSDKLNKTQFNKQLDYFKLNFNTVLFNIEELTDKIENLE
ncbi:MAG: ribosome biogenesis GTP-binding protein YihA/YsxC [Ruminococcus sp.]|jgi:GTP-binding protein|nr:ribosome biogenesis GTP-binding protein YihA/YsxC [Ruminococcus sp.]